MSLPTRLNAEKQHLYRRPYLTLILILIIFLILIHDPGNLSRTDKICWPWDSWILLVTYPGTITINTITINTIIINTIIINTINTITIKHLQPSNTLQITSTQSPRKNF